MLAPDGPGHGQGCPGSASGNAFARLKSQSAAFVHYAMERPSRYQLLFAMQPIEPEVASQMEGYLKPVPRQVIATLEAYRDEGETLPAIDLPSTALLVISLAHGRIALAHLARVRINAIGALQFLLPLMLTDVILLRMV